ncbi:carbohydrate ABC transporter permease [Microbacterium sp. MPKO10]|uniref:carbohydrate ABC transporter permease n=1 Tax=Microbacterium sp. MPKO10 TaxID=2989818 RepID=UPI0022367544|nr:sugar ABC transporter permease [Microbacterium sp. MPKO10]MCW4457371.1 sugar ABC transporter permease [Microbacterium sp. MPKO10]
MMTTAPALDAGAAPAAAPRKPVSRRRRRRIREAVLPYLLVAPLILAVVVALGWPLLQQFVMSLQNYGLEQQFGAAPEWVGFANYAQIMTDPSMWIVFVRSVLFCAVSASLSMVIGMLVALLLTKVSAWARIALQVTLLLVWAMPALVTMVIWQWLFDARYGLVNWVLARVGFPDMAAYPWTSTTIGVFTIAALAVIWGSLPLIIFMIYSALTQVPTEVLEAADLDGAGPWKRFREVTLPLITPAVMIVGLLQIVWDLRVFTQIYVLQQAGVSVDETNLLGTYIYRVGIGQGSYGDASALATVVLILTLLLTWRYIAKMFAQQKEATE